MASQLALLLLLGMGGISGWYLEVNGLGKLMATGFSFDICGLVIIEATT